jgi:hypothetical protein
MEGLLTAQQRNDITLFQEVSGINDEQLAYEILENNQWDLHNALATYQEDVDHDIDRSSREPLLASRQVSASTANPTDRAPTPNTSLVSHSYNYLSWLFSAQRIPHNPDQDTQKFIGSFELKFRNPPRFFDRSYQAAVRMAHSQSKFLIVYLHSELHENTDSFCRDVLCSSGVSRFLEESSILWGGSVSEVEAFALTYKLKCKSFPFIGILFCQSETLVQQIDSIQGKIKIKMCVAHVKVLISIGNFPEQVLLGRLQASQIAYGHAIAEVRQTTTRRYD